MQTHRGTMILVFGILGIVFCPLFAPAAWIMGNGDLTQIRAGDMDPEGESLTNAGKTLGIIGTILAILWLLLFVVLFFVLGVSLAGSGSESPFIYKMF